jgi:glycosyltransferase involved in cell wall biosynthesis
LLLVEATHRLAVRGISFELVLAGDGELRAEIETSIGRHKLQGRVHITGWITGPEVRKQILASRALVLPSFAEGLPIGIMEAMALKRPVISTFVAGIPELVRPGEHGWLVPPGDVEALADVMLDCLEAPAESLARMGEAAYRHVIERHSADTEAGKLEKLFATAVKGANA